MQLALVSRGRSIMLPRDETLGGQDEQVRRRPSIAALLSARFPSAPLAAQGAPKSAALELAKQAEKLKPGEWVWKPEIAKTGPVLVYVDLGRQRATVYRNGIRIGVSTISSGKDGHETPTGVFTILEKNVVHHSKTYDDAADALSAAADLEGHRDARRQPARLPGEPWLRAAADGICQAAVHGHSDGRHGGHRRRPRGSGQAPRRGRACPGDGGRQSAARDRAEPRGRLHLDTRPRRRAARSRSSSRPATNRWSCFATASRSAAPMPTSSSRRPRRR